MSKSRFLRIEAKGKKISSAGKKNDALPEMGRAEKFHPGLSRRLVQAFHHGGD
jgi:hypothetical protein